MTPFLPSLLAFLLGVSPAFGQGAAGGALTKIGAAAAVRGAVNAKAPDASVGRVIDSGKPLYLNDHVTTGPDAHLQVLLLDETVFTLGPGSDLVLDEFVYDPATSAGKITAGIAKGTFRFVSGKIAHSQAAETVKIKLPVGTMGIRGTIAAGRADANSATIILAGPGAGNNGGETPGSISLSNGGQTVVLDRPGFGSTISGNLPPTKPSDMSGQLAGIMNALGTGPGGGSSSGGSSGGQAAAVSGGETTGKVSGQDTAAGGASAGDTADAGQVAQAAGAVGAQATQDAAVSQFRNLADGVSTWDSLQAFAAIGKQNYNVNGTYSCSGGTCAASTTGNLYFNLDIDFAARTVGSNASEVLLLGAGAFVGDFIVIGQTSFANKTGPAVLAISNRLGGNGGAFNGAISLINAAGVPAANAAVRVNYSGTGGESASGAATAARRNPPGG